jgi:hypothetical protein
MLLLISSEGPSHDTVRKCLDSNRRFSSRERKNEGKERMLFQRLRLFFEADGLHW